MTSNKKDTTSDIIFWAQFFRNIVSGNDVGNCARLCLKPPVPLERDVNYLVCTDVDVFAEPFAGLSDFVLQVPVRFVACLLPEVQVGGHLLLLHHLCQRVAVDLNLLLLYFGAAAAIVNTVTVFLCAKNQQKKL